MSVTKEERLNKIHADAMSSFDRIQSALRDERLQCLQDRRFYSIAGAQWEGPLRTQFEQKPRMEVNKIHLAIIRIFNEYRNNRVGVSFISKDGENKDEFAEKLEMAYRSNEQDSMAEEAYDNAFEEAVGGGFGAFRLRTDYVDYEDAEDERQCIKIEPIFDADSSVFFDLDAKRQDKSDAKECFVLTALTYSAYKEAYGEDPASWPKIVHQWEFDWLTPAIVFIAEYFRIEEKKETIHIYRGLDGTERKITNAEFEADETLEEVLRATGFQEIRQKKLKKKKVHKYVLSGKGVLEDCGYIAGNCIPVIPVYGKRWFIDNVERCMGHVRLAKDSQRLKNMQISKLAEIAAISSVEKPILTPEQIAGHEMVWIEDNLKNYPYLIVNPVLDSMGNTSAIGPQSYTKSPQIPPAMSALLQLTEQDMQDVLGNQQAGEQMQPNLSGKAVELIQNRLDMQTFIYISNFGKAKKRAGEVWLSMFRDIVTEENYKMKGVNRQDNVEQLSFLVPKISDDGALFFEHDPQEAFFDVTVDIGPSSASKRQATVRALTGMMQITQDPETLQVLGSMALMNMEGEGISEVRDYYRNKLIRMGVVKPTKEEMQQLQAEQEQQANQPPDANTQFLQASADQALAEAAKARADTVLTIAQSEETQAKVGKVKAETAKTLADIDIANHEQIIKTVDTMHRHTQEDITRANGAAY